MVNMDEEELTDAWKTVLLLDKTSATKSYEYFKGVIEKEVNDACSKCELSLDRG